MFKLILPIAYLALVLFMFMGPPGGAGHGWGPEVAYYLSMPSVLLLVWLGSIFNFDNPLLAILLMFAAGLVQYFLIGLTLDKLKSKLGGGGTS